MTTLSYTERNKQYRETMLAKITTDYNGWKIIKRKTVVKPVNAPITVFDYIITDGYEFQEATYTIETAKQLIDSYNKPC